MKLRGIYFLFLICFFLVSCHWGVADNEKKEKDIVINVARYDKLLNEYVEFNSFMALQKMNTEYPLETKILIEDVLELGQVNDNNINGKLKTFFSDTTLQTLMRDALVKYEDMDDVEKELTMGFRKLKKEIPSIKIPSVYSQISALNGSVIVDDSVLGFSIDKYMGEDYPLYKRFFYDYQCQSMKPERIVPDCFNFFLMSEYPFPTDGSRTLLDVILHYGKIHYVVTKILDYKSFEDEFGYTETENKWCMANKKSIWGYMVQNGHINATDPMIIRKYTKPAPYTAFFGEDAPARIGTWMGILVIDSYMKHNKDVTIEDLLNNTNYQQVLADAGFKP